MKINTSSTGINTGHVMNNESWNTYKVMLSNWNESWNLCKQAFLKGEGKLSNVHVDSMNLEEGVFKGFHNWDDDNLWHKIQIFHSVMTRAMGATDEFMSQLNYRSICKAKCLEKANQMCLQVSVHEFIELEGFITNLSSKNFSSIYIEAFAGVKIFVWNKDGNKIRFVVQQYGEGFDGDIDCNKLVIVFDVLINKAEFVNKFL